MAKKWCAAEAPAFVNGVLGRVAREPTGEAA
jgi:transcription termination factor NusB